MKTQSTITKKLWRKHFKISAPKNQKAQKPELSNGLKKKKKIEEEKIYSSFKKY